MAAMMANSSAPGSDDDGRLRRHSSGMCRFGSSRPGLGLRPSSSPPPSGPTFVDYPLDVVFMEAEAEPPPLPDRGPGRPAGVRQLGHAGMRRLG